MATAFRVGGSVPVTPNIDFKIPPHSNASDAFDALGRAVATKKSLKEQIRDAKAITDLPLDPKQYPKIQVKMALPRHVHCAHSFVMIKLDKAFQLGRLKASSSKF
ncbi:hypothetical protein F5144DRAFT_650543 [Chaetomium tenue]|uniref:Uncharacterized protein n=1 Tax=Chaetomium tenue TaxID=1854479 RepID=A0ACB7P8T3_9PEZI|nr:hypothetical protein F5144DRAFT_650543 [Chaetomium globosum]